MTLAYHEARHIIKHHVNANSDDILITDGTGMTGVVNKFQRILGLRIPENLKEFTSIPTELKPVVFISHMEHHYRWLRELTNSIVEKNTLTDSIEFLLVLIIHQTQRKNTLIIL